MIDINRPKPKRLAIIAALQAVLEQINTTDGDAFDMYGKVYRNRILLGEDVTGNPPCLSIVEAPRPDFAKFAGEDDFMRLDSWTIMIQGLVADDRHNSADDAYFLCQDVERRLQRITEVRQGSGSPAYPEIYMLGDMITGVNIAPPVVRPPEAQVSRHAFFYLPVRLGVGVKIGE